MNSNDPFFNHDSYQTTPSCPNWANDMSFQSNEAQLAQNHSFPTYDPTPLPTFIDSYVPPEQMKWFYQDPQGEIQGPFLGSELIAWHEQGFFGIDLPICPADLSTLTFRPLGEVMPNLVQPIQAQFSTEPSIQEPIYSPPCDQPQYSSNEPSLGVDPSSMLDILQKQVEAQNHSISNLSAQLEKLIQINMEMDVDPNLNHPNLQHDHSYPSYDQAENVNIQSMTPPLNFTSFDDEESMVVPYEGDWGKESHLHIEELEEGPKINESDECVSPKLGGENEEVDRPTIEHILPIIPNEHNEISFFESEDEGVGDEPSELMDHTFGPREEEERLHQSNVDETLEGCERVMHHCIHEDSRPNFEIFSFPIDQLDLDPLICPPHTTLHDLFIDSMPIIPIASLMPPPECELQFLSSHLNIQNLKEENVACDKEHELNLNELMEIEEEQELEFFVHENNQEEYVQIEDLLIPLPLSAPPSDVHIESYFHHLSGNFIDHFWADEAGPSFADFILVPPPTCFPPDATLQPSCVKAHELVFPPSGIG
jgi:hypothetical protein